MTATRALITGASAGLGKEFAVQLARAGHDLILAARRVQPMEELAAQLGEDHGVAVDIVPADLADADGAARLFEDVQQRGLAVDYLINNAGASGPDLLLDRDWQAHRRYLELMMTSLTGLCHFFIPPMAERGFGRVVNVASVAGLITARGDYSYGPTKAYVVALSKSLALSVRDQGVNVSALCPGFTHTEFHASQRLRKMKNSMPKLLWYAAEVVVKDGLAAVEKGKAVCVTGRLYRFLVPVLRTSLSAWIVKRMGVKRDRYRDRTE
jgi:short-subunit dehydrogenase